MKAPKEIGGREFYSLWFYVKIIPLELIEFIQSLSDNDGNKIDPIEVGMSADFPVDIKTVVTFREVANNKTTITEYADFGTISSFSQMDLAQSMNKMMAIFG